MIAPLVQLVIGLILLVEGILCIQEHPHTAGIRSAVRTGLSPLLGEEYELPGLTVGVALLLLAAFALVNAFLIVAAQFGFWVV